MATDYTGEAVQKTITIPVHGNFAVTVHGVSQPGAGNAIYRGVSTDYSPSGEPSVYVITYDEAVVASKAKSKAKA